MEDLLSIDWNAEFSNHEGYIQAQWDIFAFKIREAKGQCIPKKVISPERAQHTEYH